MRWKLHCARIGRRRRDEIKSNANGGLGKDEARVTAPAPALASVEDSGAVASEGIVEGGGDGEGDEGRRQHRNVTAEEWETEKCGGPGGGSATAEIHRECECCLCALPHA